MYFEEFEAGTQLNIDNVVIDKNNMLDFAKKYDYIPLHTDEGYAKKTMFGNLIAPGVMSFMAVWAKYLETNLSSQKI